MRLFLPFFTVLLMAGTVAVADKKPAPSALQRAIESIPAFAPNRVLVKFRPGTAASAIGAAHRKAAAHTRRVIPHIDVHVVQVPAGSVPGRIAMYRANPNVEFAEPDYNRLLVLPDEGNDPPPPAGTGADFFAEQWGMNNTGQLLIDTDTGLSSLSGEPDADIDAPEGWDISTGDVAVKIAILDSGIDCAAVEMIGKCVEQISFVTDYSSILGDLIGHGTHVAGIAAARTDNGIGVAGVGWNASIGNIKSCYAYDLIPGFGFYLGVCPVSSSASAIIHAADNGYHVINMSYASDVVDENGVPLVLSTPPNAETAAVEYAWSQGVVLVSAAGNDGLTTLGYPAAYDDVIAVGATDRFDNRASFSTFGNDWVAIMAPGDHILSVEPDIACLAYFPGYIPGVDDCASWKSGTSMASPHVAGAVSLLWAHLYPGQSPQGCLASNGMPCNAVVRDHLQNGADANGALGQNFLAWSQHGRLNLYGMLSDGDGDGVLSPADNCPDIGNADQFNNDGDSRGDLCDPDDDNDGLEDTQEISLGTDPLLADTDGDTLSDFDEVNQGLNPLAIDSDGDGLRDDSDPIPLTFNFNDGDLAPLGAPDGIINVADYLVGQRIAAGTLVPSELEYARGDLYPVGAPDGVIGLPDLIQLQKLMLP